MIPYPFPLLFSTFSDSTCLIDDFILTYYIQIAGAIDSALHTTAELLGRQNKPENVGSELDTSAPLLALGREFLTLDDQRRAQKTDISSRRFKACVIPKHMNVQYMEVF